MKTKKPESKLCKPGQNPLGEIFIRALILPDGNGSFKVVPQKPVHEVGTDAAMKILGYKSRASMYDLMNDPCASKYLVWRRSRPGKLTSKIIWDFKSLLAYLEASKEWNK